jgi:hypothetical protein
MEKELCLTTRHLLHSIVKIASDMGGAFVTAKSCTRELSDPKNTLQLISSFVVKAYFMERKTALQRNAMQCNAMQYCLACPMCLDWQRQKHAKKKRDCVTCHMHPAMSVPYGHMGQLFGVSSVPT